MRFFEHPPAARLAVFFVKTSEIGRQFATVVADFHNAAAAHADPLHDFDLGANRRLLDGRVPLVEAPIH